MPDVPALPPHSQVQFVTVTYENDVFAGFDRHYTNGMQLAFLVDRRKLPEALRSLPPLRWSSDPDVVLAIGQRLYTPLDSDRNPPSPTDRPYAGWLYAMADMRIRNGRALDHLSASLGVVGPAALGRQTQDLAHRLFDSGRSNGWSSQIGNEATVMLGYERTWPSIAGFGIRGLRADISPRVGATIGNVFTYANAGFVARLGRNMPDDVPAASVSLGPPRDGYRGSSKGFGWYVWAGAEARAVGWNIFLDGNTTDGSKSVKRRIFGQDSQVGIVAAWPRWRLGFTYVSRGREFETQEGSDQFGQLSVSFAY
jgi:lipid A 3-O-deacylase